MEKNIEMTGGGIKCDNTECTYFDDTVKIEELESFLNKPCPDCGENLLTEEDYKTLQNLFAAMDFVNSLSVPEVTDATDDKVNLKLSMDGTGDVKMEFKPEE